MWNTKVKQTIKQFIVKMIPRVMFTVSVRETLCRQEFLYNAFKTLKFNKIDGDYAEFGCWTGNTFTLAYHEARRHGHKAKLWAFDSFKGLPEPTGTDKEHPMWKKGSMSTSLDEFHRICKSKGVPSNAYRVVPGCYEHTLPRILLGKEPNNICLAYIDCDLYFSTRSVLEFLMPRIKHGMIIAFDDYFCFSSSDISGERKAFLEFFSNSEKWNLLPYMQFGWGGNSFIIEDKSKVNNKGPASDFRKIETVL